MSKTSHTVRILLYRPGCFRSLLFMAAKFGTFINLGGVAELVLQAQMGSAMEKLQ